MKNKLKLLYNPFERVAGWQAFAIGLFFLSIAVLIAYTSGTILVGVTNLGMLGDGSLLFSFISPCLAVLIFALLFYIAGRIFSQGVRFQDTLGTVTLARFPHILLAATGSIITSDAQQQVMENLLQATTDNQIPEINSGMIALVVVGILSLPILVWYVALLWNAFRISTDIRGKKGIVIFILIFIIGDVLSRYAGSFFAKL